MGTAPVKQEYYSDNSVSLPGMGLSGPVGFEPGMFKADAEQKQKLDKANDAMLKVTSKNSIDCYLF